MDKFGVETTKKNEEMDKYASEGCPRCGGKVEMHGQVLWCPRCGSEPFENRTSQR